MALVDGILKYTVKSCTHLAISQIGKAVSSPDDETFSY